MAKKYITRNQRDIGDGQCYRCGRKVKMRLQKNLQVYYSCSCGIVSCKMNRQESEKMIEAYENGLEVKEIQKAHAQASACIKSNHANDKEQENHGNGTNTTSITRNDNQGRRSDTTYSERGIAGTEPKRNSVDAKPKRGIGLYSR